MARTQTLERPLHVEAPSRLRTVLRYNLWLVIAVGVILFGAPWMLSIPYELDTAFAVVMVMALTCAIGTYAWQRGQPDRYPVLLLAGMVVGLAGGLVSTFTAGRAAGWGIEFGGGKPFALGVVLLVAAAVLAFASLVQLFLFQREGRGRWIAAYLLVWSGFWAGLQQAWLVDAWVVVPDDVHLAVIDDHYGWDGMRMGGPTSLLSLASNGEVYFDSRSMSSEPNAVLADDAAVRSAVIEFARLDDSSPRGALLLALDRDERFGRSVTVLDACAAAGRTTVLLVATTPDARATRRWWYPGGILVGTGAWRAPHGGDGPEPLGPMDLRLVQGENGALSFALEGGEPMSYDVLLETLAKREDARDRRRVRVVASADLRWEPVMRFVDRFQSEELTFIDGFAVAD